MHLEVTAEVLASQLGYGKNQNSIAQIKKVMDNTPSLDKFSKHIISLNDLLQHLNAHISLSNSVDYLKIKCDGNDSKELDDEFYEVVSHWANKHNIKLQKVENKMVYYILGHA